MNDKLKPCPFCGSNNIYSYKACGVCSDDAWLECLECGIKTKAFQDEQEAIEAWNKRAQPTFTPDELDAIKRMFLEHFPRNPKIEQSIIDKCNHALTRSAI